MGVADPRKQVLCYLFKTSALPVYRVEFVRSTSKYVCKYRSDPKNWKALGHRPLAEGEWLTPEIPQPHTCYAAEFGRRRSKSTRVVKDIRLSRSLKVIVTDTYRSATYDFLLTFHGNHGPISYRFRDKRWFLSKFAFSQPVHLVTMMRGFLFGILKTG